MNVDAAQAIPDFLPVRQSTKMFPLVLHCTAPLAMLSRFCDLMGRTGLPCQRRDYDLAGMQTPDEVHLVWGMRHRPPVYQALAQLKNVFFLENGWFTQATGFYIDKLGPNGLSSIRGARQSAPSSASVKQEVERFIAELHKRVRLNPMRLGYPYLFVPLQVERDTQLLYWSGCDAPYPRRQEWFVEAVCKAFPRERIVVRPHPRDRGIVHRIKRCPAVLAHKGIEFRFDRTTYDWIAGARAVVGINSTVLLEALTFYRPICAMGEGVFSNNGVMLECKGDRRLLGSALAFKPNADAITQFLGLLLRRQIPYQLTSNDIDNHDVLLDVIRTARHAATGLEVHQ